MTENYREDNQQQKKKADKFWPVAQFKRNKDSVFGNEYRDRVYDNQPGHNQTANPMKSEKTAKPKEPIQAFQTCAQNDLQQQQTPGNHPHCLTRAQKLSVSPEFI